MVQLDLELLLTHDRFVRSIARSILRDDADVDDVVQETYRIALTSAPQASPTFAAWLATVTRRLALGLLRTRSRRERLARDVTPGKPPPSAHDILEREEWRRRVVAAVLDLEEPYRGTVLLVHFEGLSPGEAARRQQVPIDTIRTRLKRARARLREHFGRGEGSSRALAGLAGIAATAAPASAASGAVWTVAMTTAWKAAIAVTVIGFAAWWIVRADRVESPSSASAIHGEDAPRAEPTAASADLASESTPTRAPSGTRDLEEAPPVARHFATVRGRLLDASGRPVVGATVRRVHPALRHTTLKTALRAASLSVDPRACETDADGVFTWSADAPLDERGIAPGSDGSRTILLESARRGYATWSESVRIEPDAHVELGDRTLLGAAVIAGVVRDATGNEVADAIVGVYSPQDGTASPGDLRLFGPAGAEALMRCDERGAFRFDAVSPRACEVWATTPNSRCTSSGRVELVEGAERFDVVVVLEPYAPEDTIEGFVRRADGTPCADVMIDLSTIAGAAESHTFVDDIRADGSFVAYCPSPGPWELAATSFDLESGSGSVRDVPSGARDVVLTLRPPSSLTLRVTDSSGARIETIDVEAFGRDAYSLKGIGLNAAGLVTIPGVSGSFHLNVSTPEHAPQSFGPFDSEALPAVIDVVLTPTAWLRGRVVDAAGAPIAGARILEQAAPPPGLRPILQGLPASLQRGEKRATSSTDGRFRIEAERPHGEFVRVDAAGYAPRTLERSAFTAAVELTIELTAGGVIEGRCARADGSPCVGAIVVASCGDGYPDSTRCDAEGAFRFEHRTPGRWLVRPWFEDVPADLARATNVPRTIADDALPSSCVVREGGVTVQDLVVPASARAVTGSIQFEGAPLRPARAELAVEAGGHTTTTIASDGTFSCDAWSDGPATLFVEGSDFERFGSLGLELPLQVTGSTTAPLRRVVRGGVVRGRVVGERTPWMQIIRYSGRTEDATVRAAVSIASDGTFTFAWLPVGLGSLGIDGAGIPIEITVAGIEGIEVPVSPR